MPLSQFHPAVARWFERAFPGATAAQAAAWPAIKAGRDALIAAPTGSGKTLAAFLAAIDELVRAGLDGTLEAKTSVVYVSPLKALSNDVRINLSIPLQGIAQALAELGLPEVRIEVMVRTGDTPPAERARMRRQSPHIVVTTPESLYVLLGSESGREMLKSTSSVIVDEIHAVMPSKRGSHLALSLERLQSLCARRPTRIGLSATAQPLEAVAAFLCGGTAKTAAPGHVARATTATSIAAMADPTMAASTGADRPESPDCAIVSIGHHGRRDLAIVLPDQPLTAVLSHEMWDEVYARLARLVEEHRTTLVFVNTRRLTERVSRHLSERLGKEFVAAHHGSLSKEHRLDAEQRLKAGKLKVLVATASLELGIDIGDVDLVCQISSPRSLSSFLQRVGRSGHAVGGTPKGRLFAQSRDDLVECAALLDGVRRGEMDALRMLDAPLDVLAQQIVAEVGARDWPELELYQMLRGACPYANLSEADFNAVVATLSEGFTTRRGPRQGLIHRDAVNRVLHARRGTRLTALTSGGAIPDTADYDVVLEPQALKVGTINEDFAVESIAGDIFQLGNHSYRIIRVERSRVRVEDAQGAPPSIPFWLGEAPGRSDALSHAVSRLRGEVDAQLSHGLDAAIAWLTDEVGLDAVAARQIAEHLGAAKRALGIVPTQASLAMERFFDESGGTQLVIHSPYGSRVNRAWGLALRKRFCRTFNFELQAAATEDAIVLSLSTSHSFELISVSRYLHSNSVRDVLVQALLDAPMFGVRWRWNAGIALALPRYVGGQRTPPQLQRMKSEDLLATVFPDQVACAENLVGEREIPDHPLVAQTLRDCLDEAMDLAALTRVLAGLESGAITMHAVDLPMPSALALEVLSARPYAYLDDAPLEERRTQAVSAGTGNATSADAFGRLDAAAIAAVREECWPDARTPDELHEALTALGFLTDAELEATAGWRAHAAQLVGAGRVTRLEIAPDAKAADLWVAVERLPLFLAVHVQARQDPRQRIPDEFLRVPWGSDDALMEIVRARMGSLGPVGVEAIASSLQVGANAVEAVLVRLEGQGSVMRGQFEAGAGPQWCERHLLARIHRYTVRRLRREIEPVAARDYLRFLFEWQRVAPGSRVSGAQALEDVLAQLEGFAAPASAWESSLLPARVSDYRPSMLDDLCRSGRLMWTRLPQRNAGEARERGGGPVRSTPIVLLARRHQAHWQLLHAHCSAESAQLGSRATAVLEVLKSQGASFFDDLLAATRLLRVELEDALGELVARGCVHADSFAGLRALLLPSDKRPSPRRVGRGPLGIEDAGRWAMMRFAGEATRSAAEADPRAPINPEALEHLARTLLRRYGVLGWQLLAREPDGLPPWRVLAPVLHRLEARGEIRGGRFIAGLSGEQFALPEAIAPLRRIRDAEATNTLVCVSGADPLNLVGSVITGARIPAIASTRIVFRDGLPVAALTGGEMQPLVELSSTEAWPIRQLLIGRVGGTDLSAALLTTRPPGTPLRLN